MEYDYNKIAEETDLICVKLEILMDECYGTNKQSFTLALADTLIRCCVTMLHDDEEDFRERLRSMYLAFEEYKKAWEEIKQDVS